MSLKELLGVIGTVVGFLTLAAGAALVMTQGRAVPLGVPLLLFGTLCYGWMLFAYLHYHQARQEEFLQLLTTAVESEAPLAPALWSYLSDRPHGPVREFWVAVLLFFVIPGYYWVWHRRHSFDHKVARVACLLEDGWPLSAPA